MTALAYPARPRTRQLRRIAGLALAAVACAAGAAAPPAAALSLPVVTSISPSSGWGGTQVTLAGTNLDTLSGVRFGVRPGTIVAKTTTSAVVTVPDSEPGPVAVSVIDDGGTFSAGTFTYVAPGPRGTLSPTHGKAGDTVTITGQYLTGGLVVFGQRPILDSVATGDTRITFVVPAGSGTVNVNVATNGGRSGASVGTFTYDPVVPAPALPVIRGVSPKFGLAYVGGVTLITGTNLRGTKRVTIGDRGARFTPVGNSLLVFAPAQPAGTYPVTVATAAGTSTPSAAATYTYRPLG